MFLVGQLEHATFQLDLPNRQCNEDQVMYVQKQVKLLNGQLTKGNSNLSEELDVVQSTDEAKVTIAASSGSAPLNPYEAEQELVPYISNKIRFLTQAN